MGVINAGELIKAMRKTVGLSQRELAKKVYVSHAMISLYEKGRSEPSYSLFVTIANACGYRVIVEKREERSEEE